MSERWLSSSFSLFRPDSPKRVTVEGGVPGIGKGSKWATERALSTFYHVRLPTHLSFIGAPVILHMALIFALHTEQQHENTPFHSPVIN